MAERRNYESASAVSTTIIKYSLSIEENAKFMNRGKYYKPKSYENHLLDYGSKLDSIRDRRFRANYTLAVWHSVVFTDKT